ncbi:MAG: hypothetical protein ABEI31_00750 [Halodesulfurarchaeum sp.]
MPSRWSPYVAILIGVLLLAAPALWQPSATYATVTYDATPVEVTEGYIQLQGGALTGPIDGLACYGVQTSRYCALERYVAAEGPITVAKGGLWGAGPEFVAAGGFFRPTRKTTDDRLTLGVSPVDPKTVVEELSRPLEAVPPPAREAIETGTAVTRRVSVERLNRDDRRTAFFVAGGDSYVLVHRRFVAHEDGASPLETPFKVIMFLLGLALVLRGGAKRHALGDAPF